MIKKLFKKSLKKTICLVMILSLVAVSGLSLNGSMSNNVGDNLNQ